MKELTKNGKPTDPIKMLKEIEAYLTFRLLAGEPNITEDDIHKLRDDLTECLKENGHFQNVVVYYSKYRSLLWR